jgi:hypothetical protein
VRSGKKRLERREGSRSGSSKSGGRGGSEEVIGEEWPERGTAPGRRPTVERWGCCDHLLLEVLRMCSGTTPAAVHLDDNFSEGAQLDLGHARRWKAHTD